MTMKNVSKAIGGFIDKRTIVPLITMVATAGFVWGTTITTQKTNTAKIDSTKCELDTVKQREDKRYEKQGAINTNLLVNVNVNTAVLKEVKELLKELNDKMADK